MTKLEARPGRFSAGYDESMEETVRPNRKRTSEGQFQSAFEVMRAQSEQNSLMPGTPSTGSFPDPRIGGMGQSVQQSPHISDASFKEDDYLKFELSFDSQHDADPAMHRPSSSYQGSMPSTPQNANFPGTLDLSQSDAHSRALTSPYAAASMLSQSSSHHSSPHRSSPHRRTDSIASMQSAASIAGINIEDTKTETGVTIDDIAQYIEGPDLQDGRWTCNFEDCGKRFGRKENIKSHVQTHLNDRQYKCPHCQKCFVRQHDLKRHAKIHTGIKPYPCECGNSFARHDALTRHRQRGMCVGAFDGVVRKVVKRGRPKKNRPEMEERLEKSARQRKKNMSVSSVSSSTYTDHSSAVTSPNQDMTMVDNMMGIVSSAPMPSATAFATSMVSPLPISPASFVSPEAVQMTPSHPASPAQSSASYYTGSPAVEQVVTTVSTETASLAALTTATTTATSSIMATSGIDGTLGLPLSDHDNSILLGFGADDSPHLNGDNSLLFAKYSEGLGDQANEFYLDANDSTEDVFFGRS
jgi:regulatory protein SWI5